MSQSPPKSKISVLKRQDLMFYFLIMMASVLSYWHVLSADFVFDTPLSLYPEALDELLQSFDLSTALTRSRSLTWMSFLINYKLFDLDPFWFRLTNVILNGLCGCVLYALVLIVAGIQSSSQLRVDVRDVRWEAFFIAMFLVLHPISGFVSAYVIQRYTVLATLFSLLSVALILKGVHERRASFFNAVVLTYFAAIQSKEHVVVVVVFLFMIVLVNYDSNWTEGFKRTVFLSLFMVGILSLLPVLGASHIIATAYEPNARLVLPQVENSSVFSQSGAGLYAFSILNQMWYFFRYVFLWIAPLTGMVSIDSPQPFFASLSEFRIWLGVLLFALSLLLTGYLYKHPRFRWVGIFFAGGLCLFLTEFSTVRLHENFVLYRSYVWTPFFLVGCSLCDLYFVQKLGARKIWFFVASAVYAVLILIAQQDRLTLFNQPLKMWEDAVQQLDLDDRRIPASYRTVGNYATALGNNNQIERAVEFYKKATEMNPGYVKGWEGVGSALALQGKLAEAVPFLEKAAQVEPNYKQTYYNLGTIYSDLDRFDLAEITFEKALRLDPKYIDVLFNYGNMKLRLKDYNKAIELYQRALQVEPLNTDINHNLGIAYSQINQFETAMKFYDNVIRVDPNYTKVHYNRANALAMLKRYDEALREYELALKFEPHSILVLYNSARMLQALNRKDLAIERMKRILELNPKFEPARQFLNEIQ